MVAAPATASNPKISWQGGRVAYTAASEQEIARAQADYDALHSNYQRLTDVAKAHPNMVAQQDLDNTKAKEGAAQGARLSVIRVANAPCSWGVLEYGSWTAPAPASEVLDEISAALGPPPGA